MPTCHQRTNGNEGLDDVGEVDLPPLMTVTSRPKAGLTVMLFVPRPLSDAIEKAAQEWKSKAEAGKPHQMVVAAAQHGLRLCWLASMRL